MSLPNFGSRIMMGHRSTMLERIIPHSFAAPPAKSVVAVLALGLMAAAAAAAPSQNQDDQSGASRVQPLVSLSDQARNNIIQWVLAHPDVNRRAPGHRLVAIRVTAGNTRDAAGGTKNIATVVLFDHTALETRRVTVDADRAELLAIELVRGRPQSSREEFAEAVEIVRRDRDLARFLDQGGVVDGGFIVDDPAGSRRRMIQLKILTKNRLSLLRSITVDLTRSVIASP